MRGFLAAILVLLASAAAAGDELVYAFNSGSQDDYMDVEGNLFEADRAYVPGDAGYVNGFYQQNRYVPNMSPWTSLDYPLHYQQNRHLEGYRFDLPNGDYMVRLYFLDPNKHGPNLRIFHVDLEGERVLESFDICERVGYMSAYERSFLTTVQDGCLDLEMVTLRGEPLISAVAVWSLDDPGDGPDSPEAVSAEAAYGMNVLRWTADWHPRWQDVLIYRSEDLAGPYEFLDSIPYNRRYFTDYEAEEGEDCYYRLSTRDIWGRESDPGTAVFAGTKGLEDTGLPLLRLNMVPEDLDTLNAYPFLDFYYGLGWAFDDDWFQQGEGRYRGGLARFFPKKSWKVRPGVEDAFEHFDDLLLISNPDDNYVIRNHVSMKFFDELPRVWHSELHWIAMALNGEYRGVYDLTEPVDEEFLTRRGETEIGNLYKAYGTMSALATLPQYRLYYEHKAGEDESYADIMDFIGNVSCLDDSDIGPYLAENLNLEGFNDYYAHMVYTRQYDFIERNYYLYHSPRDGRWSLFPWDLTLSFWPEPLALDFGTQASPHFWDGSWNRLVDRVLTVPRLRWDYAKRLQFLNDTGVLHYSNLADQVTDIYNEVQVPGRVDPFRPWFATGDYFDTACEYIRYRVGQRDDQLASMLPPFLAEIPTLSLNEISVDPEGIEAPWVEIYNFGDETVSTLGFALLGESNVNLPLLQIGPGDHALWEVDEGGVPGSVLSPQGGAVLLQEAGGTVHDCLRYGPALAGYTQGHVPDGWVNWVSMSPSPGAANSMLSIPRIDTATMTPEQPLPDEPLALSAVLHSHPLPLSVAACFVLGDSSWSRALQPSNGDSTLWEALADPVGQGGILHWWVEAEDSAGMRATLPRAAPDFYFRTVVKGGPYAIFVNELMADNETTIADEAGDYEDWIELHNAGSDTVDLAGCLLSDDLEVPDRWTFPGDPASRIPPGGYILVWCDEEPGEGPLHADFRLDREGEEIGFFLPDSTPVNALDYELQQEDVSYGRVRDADPIWDFQIEPSPGAANLGGPGTDAPPAARPLSLAAVPNPFNPAVTLSFELPEAGLVELVIFDLQGRRVKTLLRKEMEAGSWSCRWEGRDERGHACSSGVYLARVSAAAGARSRKLVLLK